MRIAGKATDTQLRQTTLMPNIALVLKEEISRLVRKEMRGELTRLRQAVTAQKSDIAELKRTVKTLDSSNKRLVKQVDKQTPANAGNAVVEGPTKTRFSAQGLASHRKRLGLSAVEAGLLVGASDQSIKKWESGEVRPRAKHLAPIAALGRMGKREVARCLAQVRAAQQGR